MLTITRGEAPRTTENPSGMATEPSPEEQVGIMANLVAWYQRQHDEDKQRIATLESQLATAH